MADNGDGMMTSRLSETKTDQRSQTYAGQSHHSPAYKIANDICMADDDLVAVFWLVGVGTVEVLAESRLYPSAVLKHLQTARISHNAHSNGER